MRSSLWKAAIGLGVFIGGIAIAGFLFEAELGLAARYAYAKLGVLGLCLIVFVCDSLTAPFPPDVVLVVVAKSDLGWLAWVSVLLFSATSILAGNVAFWLGGQLKRWPRMARWLARAGSRPRALIGAYGRRAIALAAITPIPFSITCMLAGMLDMPHSRFWPVTFLRIPRFFGYFLLIYWL